MGNVPRGTFPMWLIVHPGSRQPPEAAQKCQRETNRLGAAIRRRKGVQMSPMTQQLLIPPLASHGGITVLSSARRPGPSSQQVGWRSSRRWLLASGGALAGAALAACAGGSPSPAPAAKPVAIDYWHIFGGTDTPTMDHMVAAFQASHPTITVNTTQIGFNDFTDKITVAFASGTPPNVFMNGPAPHASAYGILRQVKSVD